MERILTDKMNYLAEKYDIDLFLITYEQSGHPLSFPIHSNIKHIDLDVKFYTTHGHSLIKRLFMYLQMRHQFKKRLKDVYIRQSFNEDYSLATLTVECDLVGSAPILYGLASPKGDVIATSESTDPTFTIEIQNPLMWNDETPYVYTLFLTVEDEIVPFQLGLCEVKIENKVFLVNGKGVKLRGINRHDSNPETGYAVDMAHMTRDLYILKQGNVNAEQGEGGQNAVDCQSCLALPDPDIGFLVVFFHDGFQVHGLFRDGVIFLFKQLCCI